jgi:hypothetical protein
VDKLISVVDGEHARKTVNRLSLTAQPGGRAMKFKKSIVGVLAMLPLVAGLTLAGVQRGAGRDLAREAGGLSRPR